MRSRRAAVRTSVRKGQNAYQIQKMRTCWQVRTTSNLKKHLESQHSTVKFTEQVPPAGVMQRVASKATASSSPGGPPPPKQQKLDFGAKQVSGGELKKLVGWYVVEEMLPLNTVDSSLFGAIINKILTTINAMLGVTVKKELVVIFMLRQRGCCWQLLNVTNKVTCNLT